MTGFRMREMAIERPRPPNKRDFDLGDGIFDWEGYVECGLRYRRQIDRYRLSVLLDSEEASDRFQDTVRGIERRWDDLMRTKRDIG